MKQTFLYYLFIFTLVAEVAGAMAGISLGIPGLSLYLLDIAMAAHLLYWIVFWRRARELLQKEAFTTYFLIFIGILLLSNIASPIHLTIQERIVSLLYIVRFLAYSTIYLSVRSLKTPLFTYLLGTTLTLAVIGWLQYWLYPDLRNLYYLGWDPHDRRIFSTFLDPNFFGLFLVFGILMMWFRTTKLLIQWKTEILLFITLAFTYSRSSYLALFCAVLAAAVMIRKKWIVVCTIIMLVFAMLSLPKPQGESANLLRVFTIMTRIDNAKQAIDVIRQHPILGVGFNTLRYAKREKGLIGPQWQESHSAAGFDNSFLFVAATSGLIGLATLVLLLMTLYKTTGILGKTTLIALVVHAQFVNSLFFPFLLVWVWMILGMKITEKS